MVTAAGSHTASTSWGHRTQASSSARRSSRCESLTSSMFQTRNSVLDITTAKNLADAQTDEATPVRWTGRRTPQSTRPRAVMSFGVSKWRLCVTAHLSLQP
jgi:hypothetical protein